MDVVFNNTFGRAKEPIAKRYTVSLAGEEPFVTERQKGKIVSTRPQDTSWYYLGMVGQIGFAIAIPIAGGAFLGSYLDRAWGLYPKMTLGLLVFGIILSGVNFYKTVQEILKK